MIALVGFRNDEVLSRAAERLTGTGKFVRLDSLGASDMREDKETANHASWESVSRGAWVERHSLCGSPELCRDGLLEKCLVDFWRFSRLVDRGLLRQVSQVDVQAFFAALVVTSKRFLDWNPGVTGFVFESTPHLPAEFVLALVAAADRRSIYVLRPTQIPNRIAVSHGIDLTGSNLLSFESGTGGPIRDSDFSQVPRIENSRRINREMLAISKRRELAWWLVLALYPWRPVYAALFRIRGRSPLQVPAYAELSRWQEWWLLIRMTRHRSKVLRSMHRVESRVGLPDQFVYFALSYQPERTSDPEAGYYSSLPLAVGFVHEVAGRLELPVVVKEHPKQHQFPPQVREWSARSPGFYESVSQLPGVSFVDRRLDSRELIADSRLVVTLSDSAAWEGLVAGRPVLTLCPTWLDGCRAVVNVTRSENVLDDARYLLSLSKEEINHALIEFVSSLRQVLVESVVSQKHLSGDLSEDLAAENLASALSELVGSPDHNGRNT